MPYLRLLTNALVAGALGAAMLVHVVLLLNPHVPLEAGVLYSIAWRVLVTAGAMLTAGFFFASLARYLSTRRGPAWLSLRLLAWMTTLVVSLGTLLAWLNLSAFGPSLSPGASRRFLIATVTLAGTALVLLVIALVHYGFGRRGSRVGGLVSRTRSSSSSPLMPGIITSSRTRSTGSRSRCASAAAPSAPCSASP